MSPHPHPLISLASQAAHRPRQAGPHLPAGDRLRLADWALPILAVLACSVFSCRPGVPAETEELATGVYHHTVSLIDGPWVIHVVEVDLRQAWEAGVRVRTVKASASPSGLEKTSTMARGALAAVNGDFFHDSHPVRTLGLQISEGALVENPRRGSAFAMSDAGHPTIAVFNVRAGLITASGESLPIAVFNRDPNEDALSYYNRHGQARRDSVHAAVGFHLQSLGAASAINDTVEARVLQVRRQAWPLRLGADEWFVAAGARHASIADVAAGDTVGLYCLLPPVADHLAEAVGGGPRIIRDGEVSVEHERENLGSGPAQERHPRTAVGYSRDGGSLFLVTVDGHQPGYSVGMSLEELAQFMTSTLASFSRTRESAYQALNLDGGKSTTMVVKEQVVNRPSYPTGEQAVANALTIMAESAKESSHDAAL